MTMEFQLELKLTQKKSYPNQTNPADFMSSGI